MNNKNNKGNYAFPIVVLSGIALTLVLVFWGVRADNQTISIIGVGIFFLTVISSLFIGNGNTKSDKSGKISDESVKTAQKYEPLLLDERTKQEPEVQRLLQYPTVQKVFFDPEFLKTDAAQNDPQVRELLAVLDNIIAVQTANGVYPPSGQGGFNGNSAYANALMQKEIERREKEKNRPRRIAGTVLMCAGLALFIVPFSIVFIASMSGSAVAGKMSSFLFTAAPFGMLLLVVGSIVGKR